MRLLFIPVAHDPFATRKASPGIAQPLSQEARASRVRPERSSDLSSNPFSALEAVAGLPAGFVKSLIGVESVGSAKKRTGRYAGLGQFDLRDQPRLHRLAGLDPSQRFNPFDALHAIAAIVNEAREHAAAMASVLGRSAQPHELYLAHQQGLGGVLAQLRNPHAPAWQNIAATAEGRRHGAAWARQAIWGNLTPRMKAAFGTLDHVSGGDFLNAWRHRFAHEQDRALQRSRNRGPAAR